MGVWVYGCMGVCGCMSVCLFGYGRMGVWVYGCIMYVCICVWVYGCMGACAYGCAARWLDRPHDRTAGACVCVGTWAYVRVCVSVWVHERMLILVYGCICV